VLAGHGGEVYAVSWSPDGGRLVTASADGTAQVWDAASGAPVAMLGHRGPVVCAVFSPDGERIATSSVDGKVRVWSAAGRGEPVELEAGVPMLALTFLDGGKALLGVASDDTTYRWTIDAGALRAALVAANLDCLPAETRATYLGELLDVARKNHAACEVSHGRSDPGVLVPDPIASPAGAAQAPRGPLAPGAAAPRRRDERRVTVFVLPGDAVVEAAGRRIPRRDGVIDVLVKVGKDTPLRVSKGLTGTRQAERSVVLQAAVGSTVVDLNEKSAPRDDNATGRAKAVDYGFDD
jgi:WD40 repeat protein